MGHKPTFDFDKAVELFKQGVKVKDIAEQLGTTPGTLLTMLHHNKIYREYRGSNASTIIYDGGARHQHCALCGKPMYVAVPEEYVYRTKNPYRYYCSYTCYRKVTSK